jgi:hypothetical protein
LAERSTADDRDEEPMFAVPRLIPFRFHVNLHPTRAVG